MRVWRFLPALLLGLASVAPARAGDEPAMEEKKQADDGPADLFLQGWLLSRDAEKLSKEGDQEAAKLKMARALKNFEGVQLYWPGWRKEMVANRLAITRETLKAWGGTAEEAPGK